MVGNVLPGGSVVPPDVPVVQLGSSDNTKASITLVEVGPLTADVNNKPMHLQKLDNEVHQNSVPALVWNLGQMKLTVGESLECLHPVARVAGSDVLADVSGQLGPPVVLGDQLQCLEAASVSSDLRVVMLLHNPATEVLILQHNDLATKQEESV
jgi:hypothetical protein